MTDDIPTTIPELYLKIDKRLALIEQAQDAHCVTHKEIQKDIDDHESRLRSASVGNTISSAVIGFMSFLAILRSFLP
jgi:hypothetical protein